MDEPARANKRGDMRTVRPNTAIAAARVFKAAWTSEHADDAADPVSLRGSSTQRIEISRTTLGRPPTAPWGCGGSPPTTRREHREGAPATNRPAVGAVEALSKATYQTKRLLEMAVAWPEDLPDETLPAAAACKTARQLKPGELDELVKAYEAGATVFQLATRFGIHRTTVGQHLKARGVDTRPTAFGPGELEEAAALYRSGWALSKIGERFGVAYTTVWRHLRAVGVEMRANGRPTLTLTPQQTRVSNESTTYGCP